MTVHVAETHMGNTVLTVSGHFKRDATDTADDEMAKVLEIESRCHPHPLTTDPLVILPR